MECNKCKLGQICKSPCIYPDTTDKDIMVIYTSPFEKEDKNGKESMPEMLKNIFQHPSLKVDLDKVIYTHLVKCYADSKLEEGTIDICKTSYLYNQIEEVNPSVIITMGKIPFESLTGKTGILAHRGNVHTINVNNKDYKLLPTMTESFAKISEDKLQLFANDIQKAVMIAYPSEDTTPKTQFKICKNIEDVKTLIEYIKTTGFCSFDVETTDVTYADKSKVMTSMAISFQSGSAWTIPLYHFSRFFTAAQKEQIKDILALYKLTNENLKILLDLLVIRKDVDDSIFEIYNYLNKEYQLVSGLMQKSKLPKEFRVGKRFKIKNYNKLNEGLENIFELSENYKSKILDNIDNVTFTDDELKLIFEMLADEVFADPMIEKVAQNFKFDKHWNRRYGIEIIRGRINDTMLMHWASYNDRKHGLKEMVKEYYPEFSNYEDTVSKYAWDKIPIYELSKYNAIDADLTGRLSIVLEDELLKDERVYNFYRNLVIPSMLALSDIEYSGIQINRQRLDEAMQTAETILQTIDDDIKLMPTVQKFEAVEREKTKKKLIEELEGKIKRGKSEKFIKNWMNKIIDIKLGRVEVYTGINLASPKQLAGLMYDKHGFYFDMPYDWKKRQKVRSTNKDFLSVIEDDSGFIDYLIRARSVKHTYNTYLKGIKSRVDENSVLHTSYYQAINTGRISSRNPNLQNIPVAGKVKDKVASEVVALVKNLFTPPKGFIYMEEDYKQAELMVIAHIANETNMLEAYERGEDLHIKTGIALAQMSIEEFEQLSKKEKKNIRYGAKAANFGLCLTADTKVVTNKGVKVITAVSIEDKVLTHRGNWKGVTDIQKFRTDTIYEIQTATGKVVKSTPDHLWLLSIPAANGNPSVTAWKETEELKVGMYLTPNIFSGYHGSSNYGKSLSLYMGWYLSEGSFDGYSVRIRQSKIANKDVYLKMRDVLCGELGFTETLSPSDIDVVTFNSYADSFRNRLADLIDYTDRSKTKNFKKIVSNLSYEDKINLLAGLWDGDGNLYFRRRKNMTVNISYVSISLELLRNIQDTLMSLGINSKIYNYLHKHRTASLNITGIRSKILFLDIIPTVKVNRGEYTSRNNTWSAEEKIISIKKINYTEPVYDLTVEDDHSFIANGLCSHNCFGMGAKGYQNYALTNYGLELTIKEAENHRNLYFEMYPKLLQYHKDYKEKCKLHGGVRTLFGYKRFIPDINLTDDSFKLNEAQNQSVNTPVQGTAGQLTLFAIVLLSYRLPDYVKMVNSVHDSIHFYIPEDKVKYVSKIIKDTMENLPTDKYFGFEMTDIQMKIDFSISSDSWGQLEEVEL